VHNQLNFLAAPQLEGTTMDKKHCFISYNHNDEAWAKWIDFVLRENGYDTITQAYDFKAGGNFVSDMHAALKKADSVICILTKDYLDSEWCKEEWSSALEKLILIKVTSVKPDGILKNMAYIELFGLSEDKAEKELLGALEDKTRPLIRPPYPLAGAVTRPSYPAALTPIDPPPAALPPNNLPDRNPHFTGREYALGKIHEAFLTGNTVSLRQTITGLGGVGKTQTAIEYAYRHACDYKDIWWIDAEGGVEAGYRDFAKKKGLLPKVETATDPDVLYFVKRWFDENINYLFIYDNVENFGTLEGRLPRNTGHVLITTRDDHPPEGKQVDIEVFDPCEAAAFLKERSGRDDDADIGALAERLGYFPLAIEQAAAYISVNGKTCRQYLSILGEHGLDIFTRRGSKAFNYVSTVNATWLVSLEKIGNESARQLLDLCACLAPDNIPQDMLIRSRDVLPEPLSRTLANELNLTDAIYELREYSLMKEKDGYLSLHRLLQEVVMAELTKAGDTSWAAYCVDMMHSVFDYKWGDVESMTAFPVYLPHALTAAGHAEKLLPEGEDRLVKAAYLYHEAGNGLYYNNGQYAQAVEWFRKALDIYEKVLGKEHPDTATTYNNIAGVYDSQGEYSMALESYQKALDIQEKVLGKEHPSTAATYNNIALVYSNQGDYYMALEWNLKALDIREKVLGKEHPDTAYTYNNIAAVYDSQGNYSMALEWYQKALDIQEKLLGKEHPSTAYTYNNIAFAYDNQGDHSMALEWYKKSYKIFQLVLGDSHPNTITVKENMERAYQNISTTEP